MKLSRRFRSARSSRRVQGSARQRQLRQQRKCVFESLEPRHLLATLGGDEAAYDPPIMSIRLEVADVDGFPIDSAPVGGEFQLRAYVQDVRAASVGVFSAYMDLTYDPSLARTLVVTQDDITIGDEYGNGVGVNFDVPGLLDEIGSFEDIEVGAYPPPGESLLYSVPFVAEAPGPVLFQLEPPDESWGENLVHGLERVVAWDLILREEAQLTILAPGDITLSPTSIHENADTSSRAVEVGTLVASAANVTFRLSEGIGDSDKFEISGDRLLVKQGTVLDAEVQAELTVEVLATDGGNFEQTVGLTVDVIDLADGAAGITVSQVVDNPSETGIATFEIVLDQQPGANVTIAVPSADPAQATVSPTHVIFTSENWDTPQVVTVTDPDTSDGSTDLVFVTSLAISADPDYAGFDASATPPTIAEPHLRTGTIANVSNKSWTPVTLDHEYASMVVVASANYSAGAAPLTTRIRSANGSDFEVMLQRADNSTAAISATVHYTVMEEGVYNETDHGVNMEAVRVASTSTDSRPFDWDEGWVEYANSYVEPVVLGQVMSYVDPRFSTFWACGENVTDPPSSEFLYVGKHVGHHADATRANETLGYIVIESGSGTVDGMVYAAGVGADIVKGPDALPATYPFSGPVDALTAVLSPAAMDGTDGGWPVLAGETPVTSSGLKVFFEEDQFGDTERTHTPEQVAYLVLGDDGIAPEPAQPYLQTGTVTNVSNTSWTPVTLDHEYDSMVVVASVNYTAGSTPLTARIRKATGSGFEVMVQRANGSSSSAQATVYYTVVEEGVYNTTDHGVKMEARKFVSTHVDAMEDGLWDGQQQSYANNYSTPVVLGQVMTYQDVNFSTFWARGGSRSDPPSATDLWIGRHAGRDAYGARVSETLGYIVIESGRGTIDGQGYQAGVGADIVNGPDVAPAMYPLSGFVDVTSAVVSPAAMDGADGGWPVLADVTATGLEVFFDEDQFADVERTHTSEQVAYLVFGELGVPEPTLPHLQTDTVASVSNTAWTQVTLDHDYASMVVVASVNYSAGAVPLTTRIRNATGSGFEVILQRADNSTAAISATVHYTVMEEGVYNETDHGANMEAARVTSTVTDWKGATTWKGQWVDYANDYASPVVLGQVMSYVDSRFSTFWAHDGSRINPPSSTSLYVGKHVGHHADIDRTNETIGYIVIESGSGTIEGQGYAAGVGEDIVQGPDVLPATYPLSNLANAKAAVVSPAAMDGTDGGWPVLAGPTPVTATGLKVFFEEDQFGDTERTHTPEEVAYLVFGDLGVPEPPAPHLRTDTVANVSNAGWTQVTLDHDYANMVVVASVNYSAGAVPLTTRIQNANGSGFEVMLQRADNSTASISATVHYTVMEEGVYNETDHGVNMEAARVESTETDTKGPTTWIGQPVNYANNYASPVVLGQVMSYVDSRFSTFWAHDGTRFDPPSSTSLYVGKHVGHHADIDRANETIGYIVIESGSGTVDGWDYAAGVGEDIVMGPDVLPATYPLSGPVNALTALVSPAAMDGGDGGWPVLAGATPVTASGLKVFFEEDQFGDTERIHTDEQVAYLVFGPSAALHGAVAGNSAIESAVTDPISDARLQPLAAEALALWQSARDDAVLADVQLVFADLPGNQLGANTGNLITLDVDAAGVGWFVDDTPWDNAEFSSGEFGNLFSAAPLSPAVDRYDLMSVIAHELGHALGLEHTADGGLMDAVIRPGERRLPADLDDSRISDDLLNDLATDVLEHSDGS